MRREIRMTRKMGSILGIAILLGPAIAMVPIPNQIRDDGRFRFILSSGFEGADASYSAWDDARIYFDMGGLSGDDEKLIAVFEVDGGGLYDESFYLQITDMSNSPDYWPWEDGSDKFYLYQETNRKSDNADGVAIHFAGWTEGYILIATSNTGGGSWDDWTCQVKLYDNDGGPYTVSGAPHYNFGDGAASYYRFQIYRYNFKDSPGNEQLKKAVAYRDDGQWVVDWGTEAGWSSILYSINDFWDYDKSYNLAQTANGLDNWNWMDPW